jgi:hypothetical protein
MEKSIAVFTVIIVVLSLLGTVAESKGGSDYYAVDYGSSTSDNNYTYGRVDVCGTNPDNGKKIPVNIYAFRKADPEHPARQPQIISKVILDPDVVPFIMRRFPMTKKIVVLVSSAPLNVCQE